MYSDQLEIENSGLNFICKDKLNYMLLVISISSDLIDKIQTNFESSFTIKKKKLYQPKLNS